ncbi:MAG: choice-of-anchor D domain-containing protein [Bacteroidetes bacterium]|nr:choice-of-anchor D domain-containing protein [Bacteroidota bacterium]
MLLPLLSAASAPGDQILRKSEAQGPGISITPTSLSVILSPGDSITEIIKMTNNGDDTLHWNLEAPFKLLRQSGDTYNSGVKATGGGAELVTTQFESGLKPGARVSAGPRYLLMASDGLSVIQTVRNNLVATGFFTTEQFDLLASPPSTLSATDLGSYTAILVWSNNSFSNSTTIGNALNDYVDMGGGVVLSTFALTNNWAIAGGILQSGKSPFTPGPSQGVSGTIDLSLQQNAGHPVFEGITGTITFPVNGNHSNPAMNGDGILLATDTNGNRAVGINQAGNVMGIVIYPGFLGETHTKAYRLLANSLLQVGGASGWFSALTKEGSINPGDSYDFEVKFKSGTRQPGLYEGSLQIYTNDAMNPTVSVPVSMEIPGVPNIQTGTSLLNFGEVLVGQTLTLYLDVMNAGTDTLSVTSASSSLPDVFIPESFEPFLLPPDDTAQLAITFDPLTAGEVSAALTIISNDPKSPEYGVELIGFGYHNPVFNVDPTSFSADLFSGDSTTFEVTITNNGLGTLHWSIDQDDLNSEKRRTIPLPVPDATGTTASGFSAAGPTDMFISGSARNSKSMASEKYLFIAADSQTDMENAKSNITATGLIGSDQIDLLSNPSTLTIEQLVPYSAVLVWSNGSFSNPTLIGDVLKNYADIGGGVIVSTYALTTNWAIAGGILNGGYLPFLPSSTTSVSSTISEGSISEPNHPVFTGITSNIAYWSNSNYSNPSLNTGGRVLAFDTNGNKVVGINDSENIMAAVIFPGFMSSSDLNTHRLFANMLLHVSGNSGLLSLNPTAGILEPDESETVELKLKTGSLQPGNYSPTFRIYSNDPEMESQTLTVSLHVIGYPDITVTPSTVYFPNTYVGDTSYALVTISNEGEETLSVTDVGSNSELAGIMFSGSFNLEANEDTVLNAWFIPTDDQLVSGLFTLFSNDPDSGSYQVAFEGLGLYTPAIMINPDFIQAELYPGDSSIVEVTIKNEGLAPLTWSITPPVLEDMGKQYHEPVFNAVDGTASGLAAGDGIEKWVMGSNRKKASSGNRFLFMAAENQTYMQYAKNSITATGLIAPEDIDFLAYPNSVTLDQLKDYDAILLWSDGSFNNPTALGDVLKDYVDQGGGLIVSTYALSTNWSIQGGILNAGYLPFIPSATTSVSGTIDLSTLTEPDHPVFNGIEVNPVYWWNSSYSNPSLNQGGRVLAFDTNGNRVVGINDDESVIAAVIFPGFLNQANEPAQRLFAHMLLHVAGGSGGRLSLEPASGEILPGESQVVNLKIKAGSQAGDYTSTLSIFSNDPENEVETITVDLHVLGGPVLSLNPTSFQFSQTKVGTINSASLTIKNEGDEPLQVTSVNSSSSVFQTSFTESFSLDPDSSKVLDVMFAPTEIGEFSGSLTILSNDEDFPEKTVSLSGIAFNPPVIKVMPDSLVFEMIAGETANKILTIQNTGGTDLLWSLNGPIQVLSRPGEPVPDGITATGQSPAGWRETFVSGLDSPKRQVSGKRYLLLAADSQSALENMRNNLVATSQFTSDQFDLLSSPSTLTVEQLTPYAGVFVWTNNNFSNPVAIGDALKAYVDQGGGVVISTYALSNNWKIQGGILAGGYLPFTPGPQQNVSGSLNMSTLPFPSHPIFSGLDGTPSYWWNSNYSNPELNAGGTLLASDGNGNRVIAVNPAGNVIGAVIYPGMSTSHNASTNRLFANMLLYVDDGGTTFTANPSSGTLSPEASQDITLTFTAGPSRTVHQSAIRVYSNDPSSELVEIPIKITVKVVGPVSFGLIAPANHAEVPGQNVVFSWQNALNPDENEVITYTIQIASDSEFSNILKTAEVTGLNHTFTDGLPDGTVYWRVTARDQTGRTRVSNPASRTLVVDGIAPAVTAWMLHSTDNALGNNLSLAYSYGTDLVGEPAVTATLSGETVNPKEHMLFDSGYRIYMTYFHDLDTGLFIFSVSGQDEAGNTGLAEKRLHILRLSPGGKHTVPLEDFKIQLEFPSGVVNTTSYLALDYADLDHKYAFDMDMKPVGGMVQFNRNLTFNKSVQISMSYAHQPEWKDERFVSAYQWNEETKEWNWLPGQGKNGKVTASINRTGTLALFYNENRPELPTEVVLSQNYPNPFNPTTVIPFSLPAETAVTIRVYNVMGQEVAVLMNNELKPAGFHTATWNGKTTEGVASSGVYFYQIIAGNVVKTLKMTLVK